MIVSRMAPSKRARQCVQYTFVWDDVATADSYTLQIGTTYLGSERFNRSLGNVLSFVVSLPTGRYYSRVLAYNGESLVSTSSDQLVTVA